MKNPIKLFWLILFSTWGILPAFPQATFSVMEYNVENLFDTNHDSLKNDEEFLPEATRRWDRHKFWTKLIHLSQVIASAADDHMPDVVVLCEVENDSCMHYLTRRSPLRVAGYDYLMTHSPDERGIDIGFLYQRATFKPLSVRETTVDKTRTGNRPTRNILHVSGLTQTGDTLDVFCCHLPSRSSGKKHTEPFRRHVASALKALVDSVNLVREMPRIIITGDFNDEPHDKSIREVLQAKAPDERIEPGLLYNLVSRKKPGTYKFNGEWNTIDQFIVNGTMLLPDEGHLSTREESVRIHQPEFLLEKDVKYGGVKPFRTYNGMRYQGGYSDHLPIVAAFCW